MAISQFQLFDIKCRLEKCLAQKSQGFTFRTLDLKGKSRGNNHTHTHTQTQQAPPKWNPHPLYLLMPHY